VPSAVVPGFEQFDLTARGISKTVYWTGQGKPVLVMHELPGLTEFATRLAGRLAAAGFTVYLPLLFGEPMVRAPIRYFRQLCVAEEFGRLAAGVSAPITDWLRALAGELSARHGGSRVGAIGMCLTGGFVIPLMLEPPVVAPVAAQPAVPGSFLYLFTGLGRGPWMRQLNVADADLERAAERARAEELTLLAFRFTSDRLCVADKLDRLREAFGDRLEAHELESPGLALRSPHAVLTEEYDRAPDAGPGHPTRVATARVIAFLRERLGW
jgi:dienelactone hydrolase